jgi:zinc protease
MTVTSAPSTGFAIGPTVTSAKLANGMEVVVIPDHRAPVVSHQVWYRVGSSDEPAGKSGIAHFLEHLMFKGTEKIAPGEFSKIIARNGGEDNAFTTQDATVYFQRVAKDRLPLVMQMEADRMANLRLLEDDVNNERKVILEERRSRVDNEPSGILSEQMGASLYLAHPYRIPIIGWEHEMRGLTREDALAFYKRFYAPNNAVLVVAGDVEAEEVFKLAEQIYGPLKPSAESIVRQRVSEPDPRAPRRVVLKDERVAKEILSRHYLTPSQRTAAPREAESLELLTAILGSGNTGRLYKKLVIEEKKASSAGGWYSGNLLDSGRLGFYAVGATGVPIEAVEASMDAVIAEIRDGGVTEAELERVRNAEIAEVIYEADNQSNLAQAYGWARITGRTIEDVNLRAERLAAVTVADVQAAARKYLDIKRSVTGLLLPDGAKTVATNQKVTVPGFLCYCSSFSHCTQYQPRP